MPRKDSLLVPLLLAAEGLRAVTLLAFGCYIAAIATTLLVPEPVAARLTMSVTT